MIRDDRKGVLCSLQPMSPFLQRQFDGEQLPIIDIIVSLCWVKLPGEISARVESGRLSVVLRQHCSHAGGGGIHFHNEWELGFQMCEDGSSAEGLLEFLEGGSSFGVPGQRFGFLAEHGSEGG